MADPDNQRTQQLARLINRLEYNVFIASASPDLFRMARGLLPNLILLDLRMPLFEESDCLTKLRQDKPLNIIKIVMVGEITDEAVLTHCLTNGAQAKLCRPVNPTELYITIHNLIEPNPRKALRLRVVFKVDIIYKSVKKSYYATVISDQGVFIRTTEPFQLGEVVKLYLEIPSTKPVELAGKIIYQTKGNRAELQNPGIGIVFLDINANFQRNLRGFIENCLTGETTRELAI